MMTIRLFSRVHKPVVANIKADVSGVTPLERKNNSHLFAGLAAMSLPE